MPEPPFDLLAIGAINVDFIDRIDDESVSPEEFERCISEEDALDQLRHQTVEGSIGGSGFNTIRYVAALNSGLKLGFVGVLGSDEEGMQIDAEIERLSMRSGFSREFIKPTPAIRTGVCIAKVYTYTGMRILKTCPFANKGMAAWLKELRSNRFEELANSKIVHITSLLDDASAECLAQLVDDLSGKMCGGLISFDPGYNWIVNRLSLVKRILSKTDLLFLNRDELGILAGEEGDPPNEVLAAQVLNMMAPTSKIIVLKSASQVTCYALAGGRCMPFEFPNQRLVSGKLHNPVGAGDAMAAGYLASLLTKSSHFAPVALGQRLAAAKLLHRGEQEYQKRIEQEFRRFTSSLEQIEQGFGSKVFIGHGGSTDWIELDRFLSRRLGLKCIEFEDTPNPGKTTVERIEEMLDAAGFAFIVMTGEDELKNGDLQARPNVMHEVGLFHGKLGRHRAIVLLEKGCRDFSNIHGLQQVWFTKGRIKDKFEEIRSILEREGVVSSGQVVTG